MCIGRIGSSVRGKYSKFETIYGNSRGINFITKFGYFISEMYIKCARVKYYIEEQSTDDSAIHVFLLFLSLPKAKQISKQR